MFSEPSSPKPQLGLDYVSYLVKHSACREILLKCKRDELCEVVGHLDAVLVSERVVICSCALYVSIDEQWSYFII